MLFITYGRKDNFIVLRKRSGNTVQKSSDFMSLALQFQKQKMRDETKQQELPEIHVLLGSTADAQPG